MTMFPQMNNNIFESVQQEIYIFINAQYNICVYNYMVDISKYPFSHSLAIAHKYTSYYLIGERQNL